MATFYPVPTTTVSGTLFKLDSTWAGSRGAATGDSVNIDPTTDVITSLYNGVNYQNNRGALIFDTSSIPDGADITAVSLLLMRASAPDNANTTRLEVVGFTPAAADNTLNVADYDQIGTTSFGNLNFSSFAADNTYYEIVLNASGIAAISKTGKTKLALITGRDFDNSAPTGQNNLYIYFSGQAGTTKDPMLVVTYTTTNIKTVNGLAVASAKTVNGLAIASVKSINGLV